MQVWHGALTYLLKSYAVSCGKGFGKIRRKIYRGGYVSGKSGISGVEFTVDLEARRIADRERGMETKEVQGRIGLLLVGVIAISSAFGATPNTEKLSPQIASISQ